MNIKLHSILLMALLLNSSLAWAQEFLWARSALKLNEQWVQNFGYAELDVDGKRFSARLYDEEFKQFLRYTIEGKIKRGRIQATMTIHQSDLKPSNWEGRLLRIDGRDVYHFTNGLGFIGLTQIQSQ